MIPSHRAIYETLEPAEAVALWSRLQTAGLLESPPPDGATGPALGALLEDCSHAAVVLCVARESTPFWVDLIGKLIQKPIYLCARGETSESLRDIYGRPLPLPIGHRLGEPPIADNSKISENVRAKITKIITDHRIVTQVKPNPKRPTTASWQRYELYQVGMRVDEFIRAGGTMGDIRNDVQKGYIALGLPELM